MTRRTRRNGKRRPRRGLFERRGRDERGYAIVLIAGSMTVLLGVAGFSIDLGSWYVRASKMQNAADAAATAAVVYLPGDYATAAATATAVLTKNGFSDGNGVSHTVTNVAGNQHRIKVCLDDTKLKTLFTNVVGAHPTAHKCAVSEYELPVPMGSPLNEMDSASLGGIWPAINGTCTASEDGDEINSKYRAMFPASGYNGCPGTTSQPNPLHTTDGYTYDVQVSSTATSTTIEVYDGAYSSVSTIDTDNITPVTPTMNTYYTITDATLTPLDTSDDPVLTTVTAASQDNTFNSTWRALYTIPAGARVGRYGVTVTTSDNTASTGVNFFGLRARQGGGGFSQCSTIPTASNYSATCPQVFAQDHLGVGAKSSSSLATFSLVSIDPSYAGHKMMVNLFDPGEGGKTIQLLDPNGNPISFSWATIDDLSPTYSGSGTSLDVSGTGSTLPNRKSNSKFNDRLLQLTVTLPSTYAATYGSKTWWSLRYSYSGSVSDRTTWDIEVTGDPVRLVTG